jgi:hypothetical protein
MGFYQAQLLQVARKSGLGDTQFLRGETAAQLFLVADPRISNQPEDLTVAECFPCAQESGLCTYAFLYNRLHILSIPFECFCRGCLARERFVTGASPA